MTRVSFDEVRVTGHRAGTCVVCQKKRLRTMHFWQTINPYNRNADGYPKSREEILAEVRRERDAWEKSPLVCKSCEDEEASR